MSTELSAPSSLFDLITKVPAGRTAVVLMPMTDTTYARIGWMTRAGGHREDQ